MMTDIRVIKPQTCCIPHCQDKDNSSSSAMPKSLDSMLFSKAKPL